MTPLPQVIELTDLPPEFVLATWGDGPVPGPRLRALPTAAHVDFPLLVTFKQQMEAEGWPVSLARMCYDRLYAYERIAQAHASAADDLRRSALQLFQLIHRLEQAGRPPAPHD
ncbi:hypothetical protein [Aquabacterium sp. J223]|uniref:hypothetical protein n=1 Tax=Aquabacterium sp. J223 TaxID=2898431 RepID=UPI0021AD609F|nr:hypothetical protein [Aquabacterium sp. J223]UUX95426.1 hypothetical protein LRS07_19805 [Aquabacterium sp. J223]